METTTRRLILQALNKVSYLADQDYRNMAIPLRNELLDEYRRAEQTIESLAEARKDYR